MGTSWTEVAEGGDGVSKPSMLRKVLMVFGWPAPQPDKPVEEYVIDSVEYCDRIASNFSRIIYPVIVTMVVTLYLNASLGSYSCFHNRNESERRDFTYGFDPREALPGTDDEDLPFLEQGQNLYWVIVICAWFALLVVVTFLMVWIVKTNRDWILYGFLYLSVFTVLSFVGGRYLLYFCRSRCWNFDWITLVFLALNLGCGGIIAVFWVAPRWMNQAYLIGMSALIGDFVHSQLPAWALWALLAALVVWDLFAVLAPCGPLKALVKHAAERQNDLPGLLYDTNPTARGREDVAEMRRRREMREQRRGDSDGRGGTWFRTERGNKRRTAESLRGIPPPRRGESAAAAAADTSGSATTERQSRAREASKFLDKNLKLGLGDFVFYSILVAIANRFFGLIAVVTTFSAVMCGLCLTFMILITVQKPLPALPLSLTFGIIAYFVTRYSLSPFVGNLLENLMFN